MFIFCNKVHTYYISLLVSSTTFEIFKITFLGWEEKRALHAALRISQRNTSSRKNWRIQFINNWSYNDYGKNINIHLLLNQNNDLSLRIWCQFNFEEVKIVSTHTKKITFYKTKYITSYILHVNRFLWPKVTQL